MFFFYHHYFHIQYNCYYKNYLLLLLLIMFLFLFKRFFNIFHSSVFDYFLFLRFFYVFNFVAIYHFFILKGFKTSLITLFSVIYVFRVLIYSSLYVVKKFIHFSKKHEIYYNFLKKFLKNFIFTVIQMISCDLREFIKILCNL